jgi:serine/threonine-protein kinase
MAPEQLLAEGSIDGRADIFALGAMLYVLLTNERPFAPASRPDGLTTRLTGPPPDPRRVRADIPDALAEIVGRCLAPDREARFAKVEDVAAALAQLSSTRVAPAARKVRVVAPGLERRPGVRTVAVVPFHNAGAPTDAYLADGFTHDLVDALGRVKALHVRAIGAVSGAGAAPGETAGALDLARQLGADAVVEGSLFRIGDSVRVSGRVVAVENDLQLWGARMTRPFAELLAVGDDVAAAIAAALTAARDAPLRASADPVAVDFYLRARASYHEYSPTKLEAPALFEKALELAPDDPTILAGYAMALVRGLGPFSTRDRTREHACARAAAERAASVAPHLAEGHLALARGRFDDAELAAAARSLSGARSISRRGTRRPSRSGDGCTQRSAISPWASRASTTRLSSIRAWPCFGSR